MFSQSSFETSDFNRTVREILKSSNKLIEACLKTLFPLSPSLFLPVFHHIFGLIPHFCVSVASFNLCVIHPNPAELFIKTHIHTSLHTCPHFKVSDKLLNDTFNQQLLWLTGLPPMAMWSVLFPGSHDNNRNAQTFETFSPAASVSDFIKHASAVVLFQEWVRLAYLLVSVDCAASKAKDWLDHVDLISV